MGLLKVLNLQTFKNCKQLLTFKYTHDKKFFKSLNLKTSFLAYKISRIQELSEALPPGTPLIPLGARWRPKTPFLKLAPPHTSNPRFTPAYSYFKR